jgi:hypothetical protein
MGRISSPDDDGCISQIQLWGKQDCFKVGGITLRGQVKTLQPSCMHRSIPGLANSRAFGAQARDTDEWHQCDGGIDEQEYIWSV